MSKTHVMLTEEELFELLDLVMTHGAEPKICEKLANACRRTMQDGAKSERFEFPIRETVQG